MKRIYDMTKDEVLNLTDDQIDKLIDLECAIEGVPLLPPRPIEPEKPKAEPDVTAYEVAGLYFLTPEEAGRVLEAIQAGTPYSYEYVNGYSQKRLTPLSDYNQPHVSAVKMFSAEYWDKVKSKVTEYDILKKQFDTLKSQYDEVAKKREVITEAVWERINEIREENRKMVQLESEFKRYMELADNNSVIAMRFLLKAYPNAATEFPELIRSLAPEYMEVNNEE